jgi:hypothetical protein
MPSPAGSKRVDKTSAEWLQIGAFGRFVDLSTNER